MSTGPGAWLRRQREARLWSRLELARRIIKAAESSGEKHVPGPAHVAKNISRREAGTVTPAERCRLFICHALGIAPGRSGVPGTEEQTVFRFSGTRSLAITITMDGDGAEVRMSSDSPGPAGRDPG